jgi:hypothetical protein
MYTHPSAPQSIGGVLDDAVRLYRESFVRTLPLSIAASVALSLPSLLLSRPPHRTGPQNLQAMLQTFASPTYWLTYLICLLAYAVIYVALVATVNEIACGRRANLPAALRKGVERLPSMIGAFILVGLMVGVGLILLVIPGIYLWGALQLTFFPLILDHERVGAAIGISRRLVKGHWWHATTVITVIIVMSIVLEMILTFLAGLLVGLLRWQLQGGIVTVQILYVLADSLVMVLPLAGGLALYHDLKLRSEGSDLAARMEALAAH